MSWPPKDDIDRDRAEIARIARNRGRGHMLAGKARKPRAHPEQDFQITVADFLRVATIAPARWWFCPNGGNLSRAQAAAFQKMGLTPGVSDLHFAWSRWADGDGHAVTGSDHPDAMGCEPLFGVIELKAGKGVETDEQVTFRLDMCKLGHKVAVCRSLEEVVQVLTLWGFPLREVQL